MIEPHVEHGGASSWFWIVMCGFAEAARCGDGAAPGSSAVFINPWLPFGSSSSRPLTPAWNCASADRNFDASQRKM